MQFLLVGLQYLLSGKFKPLFQFVPSCKEQVGERPSRLNIASTKYVTVIIRQTTVPRMQILIV